MTLPYTCVACNIAFNDPEPHRSHYKTDWHRYNLKRKIAALPPVSAEEFRRRVDFQQNIQAQNQSKNNEYCTVCGKSFGNTNVYMNHINSKKHKENEEKRKQDTILNEEKPYAENKDAGTEEIEELDSDEWDEDTENPVDNNDCIFCLHHSGSLLKCLKHMSIEHSFFIPDAEYCVDVKGLLGYLGEKIMIGHMCIWCNEKGRSFHSAQAAQQHMLDKGHCKMIHEGDTLLEYADFYDYSKSYPDAEKENIDCDEEVLIDEIDGSDYQLVLPSGSTIGHRSLMRYYKQNIDSTVQKTSSKNINKVLSQYKVLGWTATKQEIAAKKARDLLYMQKVQAKWQMKLSLRANKLQKHFRVQCNF